MEHQKNGKSDLLKLNIAEKVKLSNLTNIGLSIGPANLDIAAFNSNPSPNNFISVVVDTAKLSQSVTAQADQLLTFDIGVEVADALGQLTPTESSALHATVTAASFRLSGLESAVNDALNDIFAAYFALVTHSQPSLTLLTAPSNVTLVSFQTPPSSVPSSVGEVSAIATISAGVNTPVTVSVTGSDGFSDSKTKNITGTGSVRLTIATGDPGVTDTFTVSIPGLPDQSATVTYT
jgi:hypothetical protein